MSQRKKLNNSQNLEKALISTMNRKKKRKVLKGEGKLIKNINTRDLKKSLNFFHDYAKLYAKKYISSLDKIIYDL